MQRLVKKKIFDMEKYKQVPVPNIRRSRGCKSRVTTPHYSIVLHFRNCCLPAHFNCMRNGRVTQCKLKFQVEEVLRYVIQFSMHIR